MLRNLAEFIEDWPVFRLVRVVEVVAVFIALIAFWIELQQRSVDRSLRVASLFAQIAQTLDAPGGDIAVRPSIQALINEDVSLAGVYLAGANLENMNFDGVDLSNAVLIGAKMRNSSFVGANFDGADLAGANLRASDLSQATVAGGSLRGAVLDGSKIDNLELAGSFLKNASFSQTTGLPLNFDELCEAPFDIPEDAEQQSRIITMHGAIDWIIETEVIEEQINEWLNPCRLIEGGFTGIRAPTEISDE